jgi:hypothetical protein
VAKDDNACEWATSDPGAMTSAMGNFVTIENARKTFGQIVALDNLSLAIRDGESLLLTTHQLH